MSSRCPDSLTRSLTRALLALALGAACCAHAQDRIERLRVCADPDNLPFSHEDGSGFENRLARLAAEDLGARLEFEWMPQRRGFVRKTFGEGLCELWMGVPAGFERMVTTRPYYRSTYVFVFRAGDARAVRSFDDPRIAAARIGVQLVGNDLAATPAGHALAAKGAVDKVVGFAVFGEHPAAQRIIDALRGGTLDAAVVWGPQAGYFASRAGTPLALAQADAPPGLAPVTFEFSIAIGVKRGHPALLDALDKMLERRKPQVDALLAEYGVPRTDLAALQR